MIIRIFGYNYSYPWQGAIGIEKLASRAYSFIFDLDNGWKVKPMSEWNYTKLIWS
ncbi:MAG: hypothetical protein QNJ72_34720 [Pleurocapsa sp. MO_226.B13]|nr:hypothetical protein [Pleurocapsa sp. MO_226.B13]